MLIDDDEDDDHGSHREPQVQVEWSQFVETFNILRRIYTHRAKVYFRRSLLGASSFGTLKIHSQHISRGGASDVLDIIYIPNRRRAD